MTPQPTEALRNGQIPTQKSSTDQYGRPISVSSLLTPSPQPINVPTPVASPIPDLENIISGFSQPTQTEQDQGTLQSEILKSLDTLGGKKGRQAELEKEAGLGTQRQSLQAIINQLQGLQKEAAAIPLQFEEQFTGRASVGQIQRMTDSELRRNSIKALGLAAIGQTLQGNIALADQNISKALEVEFEPQERRLETLKQLYTFNKDALDRQDKKKSEMLNIALNERARLLEVEKINKNEIYNIGKIASEFGADSVTVQKIFNAKTREDALTAAGKYVQDPKASIELANLKLDTKLKQAQIDKINKEISLLGEPTPAQVKETEQAIREAKASLPAMQDKITLVDAIKKHQGMQSRVGPNVLSRSLFNTSKEFTGKGQDFAGGIHKLTGGLTLQNLIEAKKQGATFGALSDAELKILSDSATAINAWEIKDKNDKGTGFWNIDEASFNRELNKIKELTQRAIMLNTGVIFSTEEQALLDDAFADSPTIISGDRYY